MSDCAKKTKDYAPILISVYNRFDHFKNCVESLKYNLCSTDSILYVVSDAPYDNNDRIIIDTIRNYVENIQGFRDVILIERETNLGSFMSITSALDFVIKKHKKVIFLEDDNVVSDSFLEFMNSGLEFYQDDPSIFTISGYNYPIKIPTTYKHDIYKWQGYSPWGVGFWHEKWEQIDWSREGIDSFLADDSKVKALNDIGEHVLLNILAGIKIKNEIAGDAALSIHVLENNMFTIFPVVSKVRNMGNDGTGEHGNINDKYNKQIIDCNSYTKLIKDIEPSPVINRILKKHFRTPLIARIAYNLPNPLKRIIKYFISSQVMVFKNLVGC